MKVSEVDFELLHKLIKSVPQGMEIESIDLTNGYSLKLIAGTQEIHEYEKSEALKEMNSILNTWRALDKEDKQSLLKTAEKFCIIENTREKP